MQNLFCIKLKKFKEGKQKLLLAINVVLHQIYSLTFWVAQTAEPLDF